MHGSQKQAPAGAESQTWQETSPRIIIGCPSSHYRHQLHTRRVIRRRLACSTRHRLASRQDLHLPGMPRSDPAGATSCGHMAGRLADGRRGCRTVASPLAHGLLEEPTARLTL